MASNLTVLLTVYLLVLLRIGLVHDRRPGFINYQNPDPGTLNVLSTMHWILAALMLSPVFFLSSPPSQWLPFHYGSNRLLQSGLLLLLLLMAFLPVSGNRNIRYAASRVIFLVIYEWFFRGFLLTECIYLFGTSYAILINIILYCLAHFHKSRREIIGCIPFGLILSLVTIASQSIWPAVAIHLLLAAKFEWRPLLHIYRSQNKPAL